MASDMTISLTPCPNSEFLLKLHDGERTVMTLVLTEAEARSLDVQLGQQFDWPPAMLILDTMPSRRCSWRAPIGQRNPMTESCETCRFYGKLSRTTGNCRRFPPTMRNPDEGWKAADLFVRVRQIDWCGEYQPAEPKGKE